MNRLLDALRIHASHQPHRPALQDDRHTISYGALLPLVESLATRLSQDGGSVTALLADNGCGWALADIALHLAAIPAVPLPLFFSDGQVEHALATARVERLITDQPARAEQLLGLLPGDAEPLWEGVWILTLRRSASSGIGLPPATGKVTFTSGTTGEPKGVCLSRDQLETAARSLMEASDATAGDRHLCVLPLPTLLENVAGLHTPLLAGAMVCLPPLADVGLAGSSGLDMKRFVEALNAWQPTTLILVPQMLQGLVGAGEAGLPLPPSLRYVAVGGAPTSLALLERAARVGVPVHEGYGLSECASVVAVNRPGERRLGSVGKPLLHLEVEIASDGEILVHGLPWLGYAGDQAPAEPGPGCISTGDLGHLDKDGFLHITGRKKSVFITSHGRNVAPEWVERELVSRPPILQAALFGEGCRFNTAVVFLEPGAKEGRVDAVIEMINRELPDYARVGAWIRASAPLSPANGTMTPNGRPRRDRILAEYRAQIDALYTNDRTLNP